jgi:hypothetical protein
MPIWTDAASRGAEPNEMTGAGRVLATFFLDIE